MDTGYAERLAHESAGYDRLVSIVSRVAFSVAVVVMVALPLGYWSVKYGDLSNSLTFKAKVKAAALSAMVSANPDLWIYEEHRLSELLTRYPLPLETESAQILDPHGELLGKKRRSAGVPGNEPFGPHVRIRARSRSPGSE